MSKKIILIFIVLSSLLIVGCTGGSGGKNPITDVDIRKGTEGLTMEFTKNAPPPSAFEDSVFPIALILRNRGAFDIKPVEIEFYEEKEFEDPVSSESFTASIKQTKTVGGILVFGFETSLISVIGETKKEIEKLSDEEKGILSEGGVNVDQIIILTNKKTEELTDGEREKIQKFIEVLTNVRAIKGINVGGKSIFNPNGNEELITLDAKTKKIGAQSETQTSTILATACYPYKTIFGTSVCIDTDIYGIRRERKACTITDLKFSKGQGAPVVITKIETRMLPQEGDLIKPHFLIHIENKGNGEVLGLDKVEEACTSQALDFKDFNTIIIKASLSGKTLDCRINKDDSQAEPPLPAPAVIRLRDKKNLVRCTLEPKEGEIELINIDRDAYIAPLSIELDYGYTFTISKDIIIEKILTY